MLCCMCVSTRAEITHIARVAGISGWASMCILRPIVGSLFVSLCTCVRMRIASPFAHRLVACEPQAGLGMHACVHRSERNEREESERVIAKTRLKADRQFQGT